MKCANKHGYSIIRLLQINVWQDKNDWEKKLKKHIKIHDEPTNIFFNNKKNIYGKHMELIDIDSDDE